MNFFLVRFIHRKWLIIRLASYQLQETNVYACVDGGGGGGEQSILKEDKLSRGGGGGGGGGGGVGTGYSVTPTQNSGGKIMVNYIFANSHNFVQPN